ncbi:hypothetical protein [Streptomyces sp. NPDC059783]|uniref:hypothetical protein n=1 Tax=Streptomyces sp. NPDC059783 TaxID=3346944 RepID=UPI003662D74F
MAVTVNRTEGRRAEISWEVADDSAGYLVEAIDSARLAYALEALGAEEAALVEGTDADETAALQMAASTARLARVLERRTAVLVVRLRDRDGLSWRAIAASLLDDADKQSSIRRMYESGRRHLGT